MQTAKQKQQTKRNFDHFEEQILPWLESALDYLNPIYWVFSVNKRGKYLPAVQLVSDPPGNFLFETEDPRGRIRFKLPSQQIRTEEELLEVRRKVWKTVSIALIATVGVTRANRSLSDLREKYELQKIKTNESWAMAPSDWTVR